jgi:hypothetical protein
MTRTNPSTQNKGLPSSSPHTHKTKTKEIIKIKNPIFFLKTKRGNKTSKK